MRDETTPHEAAMLAHAERAAKNRGHGTTVEDVLRSWAAGGFQDADFGDGNAAPTRRGA